ncbi:MAG: sigma 54-interacting transcriptional regulator [Desulfovibrio sp.]|nr:sigma 54-interacting transcriptional regulator [Desulfovibrio sp.]
MKFINNTNSSTSQEFTIFFRNRSLTSRMLLLGLPVLTAALLIIFAATGGGLEFVVNRAIARNIQLQAQGISLAMAQAMEETRNQLLILGAGSMNIKEMADRMKFRAKAGGLRYRELAFEGVAPENRYLLLNVEDEVVTVPLQQALASPTGPFHSFSANLQPGHVSVSQPLEVLYSMVQVQGKAQNVTIHVLRFTTPVFASNGDLQGYLMLSLDLRDLRDILSLHSAPDAPLQNDDNAQVRSMFFDREGWLLFQSEPVNEQSRQRKLSTDTARAGLTGIFGRPGFNTAFRPGPEHIEYWDMVVSVQNGHSGQLPYHQRGWGDAPPVKRVSYAPLCFTPASGEAPIILGGLAVLDANFTGTRTGMLLMGIYAAALIGGTLLLTLTLWWLSRQISKSLNLIICELESRNVEGNCHPMDIPALPRELERLKVGINTLLYRLDDAQKHRKRREDVENALYRREPQPDLPHLEDLPSDGIVGFSPAMRVLLDNVRKAAQVDDDVLVVGETGTGKELISEAIHHMSTRAHAPFISINCGALDENLLMDTLFGHVKGAYTEARTARKGAFLAAAGGTLMLDEVGNAAPKVQQALLRALSTRRIRPLGCDHDIPFNTRIIAATNAPLLEDTQRGFFREDLYYRLAVITINSPPLRERKDDIPALTVHFLYAACKARTESLAMEQNDASVCIIPPQISRGAMDKLLQYNWPGNVRELKNTLARALAFCDGPILYEEDIQLGATAPTSRYEDAALSDSPGQVKADPTFSAPLAQDLPIPTKSKHGSIPSKMSPMAHKATSASNAALTKESDIAHTQDTRDVFNGQLPPRLQAAWPHIAAQGNITRLQYQHLTGTDISMRTAQYDLQLLERKGLLRKEGHGRSQRYVVVKDTMIRC